MIHLITGEVHGGKTTWVKQAVSAWQDKGFPLAGFFSEAVIKDGDHIGYDLIELNGHKRHPYLRIPGEPDWPRAGRFRMKPETLEKARSLILEQKGPELLIVDEIGPMEIKGKGLWPVLEQKLIPEPTECLIVLRKRIAEDFAVMLKDADVKVYDIRNPDVLARVTGCFEQYLKIVKSKKRLN